MRKRTNVKIYSVLLLGALLLLGGCATSSKSTKAPVPCIKSPAVTEQLASIPIIQIGQTMTIVIASDRLFVSHSANFQEKAKPMLNAVACLIASYNKVAVRVKGYTDNSSPSIYNHALSAQQAAQVADYLWDYGIDVRIISADGLGNVHPLTLNNPAMNRRIEIEFREIK